MRHARITTVVLAVLALAAGVVVARGIVRAPQIELPLPPSPAAVEPEPAPTLAPEVAPPAAAEARAAFQRVFGDAVAPDLGTAAVGDFNGDGSPDLAGVVRPSAGRASEVGSDLANWTFAECARSAPSRLEAALKPSVASGASPGPRASVREGESLLAVLHGIGPRGWRDPQARQAYLLRAGPSGRFHPQPRDAHARTGPPEAAEAGDLLVGARATDVVYWNGARYACGVPPPPAPPAVARPSSSHPHS
jgi:hypothetical protein